MSQRKNNPPKKAHPRGLNMKLIIFSVYDQKAEAYLPPFFIPNAAMAQRTFSEAVNSPSHQFGKHPADYTLIELGTFDDGKATIHPHEIAKTVCTGLECILTPAQKGDQHDLPLSDDSPVLSGTIRRAST